jgi:D-alanine transaminase
VTTVYLNGRYVPEAEALIPANDRGFIFGDGIYEVVRAVAGRLFEWEGHAERLANGLAGLRIEAGALASSATLRTVCERLLAANDLTTGEATIYLQVTRGAAKRVHAFPPAGTVPTVYAVASRFVPDRAMRADGATAITYPDLRWARCDLKTVNLLGPVLARQAAAEAGSYEAILHRDGWVTEGAATTVFVVRDGVLHTTPLSTAVLPSITRTVVLACAASLGVPVHEAATALADLPSVEELMVVGTTTDVQPIVALDGRPIADGRPGPVTRRLQAAYTERLYG